jgi:hypothetical protein
MTRRIRSRIGIATAGALAFSLGFVGCDDTSKKQVKAHPPAATPIAATSPEFVRESFPFTGHTVDFSMIQAPVRPAIDILVDKVQAAYDTGQKELKARDFEKARAEFDRAVDLIQSSGFPVESDPRLSKLFDEIGDATQSYE